MTPALAGYLSSTLFIGSAFPMLVKALRTKDMRSYSRASLLLCTLGNTVHWLYVASLPLGPIYHTSTASRRSGPRSCSTQPLPMEGADE